MTLPVPTGYMGRGWQVTEQRPTRDGGAWVHYTLTSGQRLWRYLDHRTYTRGGIDQVGDILATHFDYWPRLGTTPPQPDGPLGPGGHRTPGE